jgi:tetratricopeptide (TPR) repeat protein
MMHERNSLAESPNRAYRFLLWPARTLGYGFVQLALRLVAPFALVRAWLRSTGVPAVLADPGASGAPTALAERPTTSVQPREGFHIRHTHHVSDRGPSPEVEIECVEVQPEFGPGLYPEVCALLQLGPRSKLLDLRRANTVTLDLFEGLASAWKAPPGTVRRLGVLLGYEAWAVLRHVAARRLKPISDNGVAVELFYEQQIDSLPSWFSHGQVHHDQHRAVLEWLRTKWRATASWPSVLSATATLVQASAPTQEVPELLLEIAAIALSFEGPEAAEQAAGHARTVFPWIGDKPSAARCRALRLLATATMAKGDVENGLAHLETAITTAMVIKDPVEEASALHQSGSHAFRGQHFARAEDRFRRALAVLSNTAPPFLVATLHHDLAAALEAQGKHDEEAEHHASAALELRWDKDSHLARDDRALLARVRARRVS